MLSRISFHVFFLFMLGNCTDSIPDVHSDFVPGSGLLSLASLNLTSVDLLELPIVRDTSAQIITSENTVVCGPEDGSYTDVDNLISCFNYLRILGKTPCEFDSREPRTVCWHGFNGVVVGISTTG
ncbi:hypothetical protein BKA58DRAFT_25468 [Alternaria rosae]|uniref:uncharacterized protein n=1 Tax=Alternaria rosae TaxID=1187941 RepID=UPI001E8D6AC1|nr:uncharacterized protein BKA58DRAFT_25468 [Alternaria rosae]KAH6882815.1 hypothetical protein BKA58DRAFT_25468 [Alternaria rosae]